MPAALSRASTMARRQALGLSRGQAFAGTPSASSPVFVSAHATQGRDAGQRPLSIRVPSGSGARGSHVGGVHAAAAATAPGQPAAAAVGREADAVVRSAAGQAAGRCAGRGWLRGRRIRGALRLL